MGFNTVAMILNDHMHNLAKAPHSFTWALTNPPFEGGKSREMWLQHARQVAMEHNEIGLFSPSNDINILPTFHADIDHWLYAGRNSLERLRVHKFGTAKVSNWGKIPGGLEKLDLAAKTVKTVTLILPDWWDKT